MNATQITHASQMHAATHETLRANLARLLAGLSTEATAEVAIESMVRYALSHGIGTPSDWAGVLPDAEEVEGALLMDATWRADDGNAEIDTGADCAQDAAEEYVRGGEWGNDGGSVSVSVWQDAIGADGQDVRVNEECITVDIEQDRSSLIADACRESSIDIDTICGPAADDHKWEGVGGLSENPGVWSTGGTSMLFVRQCSCCGLIRREHNCGSQRNPGDGDTVIYDASEVAGFESEG